MSLSSDKEKIHQAVSGLNSILLSINQDIKNVSSKNCISKQDRAFLASLRAYRASIGVIVQGLNQSSTVSPARNRPILRLDGR